MSRSPKAAPFSTLAALAGVPFFFCLVVGQIGGIGGAVLFGLLMVPLLLLAFFTFATGAPFAQGWWALVPLIGGAAGFFAGQALPRFMTL